MINVAVSGAAGRMGQTVCEAVEGADDMALVGRADPLLDTALGDVLGDADVVVDFSTPDTALGNARHSIEAGVHCVMGTTGAEFSELEGVGEGNLFVAPNFAIGPAYRRVDNRGGRQRPRADSLDPPARARRPPGGGVRRTGSDADDPPRLRGPRLVHARGAAGGAQRGSAGAVADRGPRAPAVVAQPSVAISGANLGCNGSFSLVPLGRPVLGRPPCAATAARRNGCPSARRRSSRSCCRSNPGAWRGGRAPSG